jgi:hypothetical protein
MFAQEAQWLADRLHALPPAAVSPLLNVGSGARRLRERTQPYIQDVVFGPQAARGVRVIHNDHRPKGGVDLVADIFDDADLPRMTAVGARAIVCSNVHEHVRDPAELSRRLIALLPSGGYLLVTVPHSYPYHDNPIDTMYRPSPEELGALHPGAVVVEQALVTAGTYRDTVRADPLRVFYDVYDQTSVLLRTRSSQHLRLRWWSRPYSVSCVLLRKP